jgi:FAD/FMN-containing dehydrogenase
MLNENAITELKANLRGRLIERNDKDYDEARKLYNAMIDKRPLLIARCADVADVITSIRFGRENGLVTAIRGGGHNGPGLGSCNDGLVIDLSVMKGIRVDPVNRTVRVEAGCLQGDVDHAGHAFGLAVPAGIVSTTGIAGLTLGGGHGYLTRKHGLTIDNLIEADVVLADGKFVTANESQNADLFWALRGGGGNFGIVTSFVYRAHPVDAVYAGPIFWDAKDARRLMQWYREFLPQAPVDLFPFLGLKTVPSTEPFPKELWGRKTCALICCFSGPLDKAEEIVKPIRHDLPSPILDWMGPMPFPALQSLFDPLLPKGMQWYWKGDFVKELSDEAIDIHLEWTAKAPSELSLTHLYPIDGAVHRIAPDATAWSCRNATWSMVIAGIDPNPAKAKAITAWAKGYWEALHPYTLGGAYVNFMMEEGEDRIKATYGDNYERLVAIKKKYDPDNFFRVNQNIKPIGAKSVSSENK